MKKKIIEQAELVLVDTIEFSDDIADKFVN